MPGEVSLVHHGMIFLGELPELSHHVIESLRESIEKGFTTIEPLHR
jgi:magnesium chelatase family protein